MCLLLCCFSFTARRIALQTSNCSSFYSSWHEFGAWRLTSDWGQFVQVISSRGALWSAKLKSWHKRHKLSTNMVKQHSTSSLNRTKTQPAEARVLQFLVFRFSALVSKLLNTYFLFVSPAAKVASCSTSMLGWDTSGRKGEKNTADVHSQTCLHRF